MSQTPSGHDPQGAYQLGRMAEALSQNTVTLTKLVEAVDENSRSTARLANRQDRMEQTIEQIQADQRKMIHINMTGQSTEADVRKKFEWLERKYQEEVSNNSVKDHGKKVLYGAILVALFWFMFALVKDAAVAEVATKLQNQTEIRSR
jgi:type II secretory pathway component PulJ